MIGPVFHIASTALKNTELSNSGKFEKSSISNKVSETYGNTLLMMNFKKTKHQRTPPLLTNSQVCSCIVPSQTGMVWTQRTEMGTDSDIVSRTGRAMAQHLSGDKSTLLAR